MTYIMIMIMLAIGFIILDDNMPDGHAQGGHYVARSAVYIRCFYRPRLCRSYSYRCGDVYA